MANWIAGAVKHPGAFKAKAQAAGEGTAEYASEVIAKGKKGKASGKTLKQALLARTLMGMHKKPHGMGKSGKPRFTQSVMAKGMSDDDGDEG
jgi:hypothetical protein